MPRTAEIKLRVDPRLKAEAIELYSQWGLNLTDAVTIFLSQSIATGGLPFPMRRSFHPDFNWSNPTLVSRNQEVGHVILPAEWDAAEDSIYEKL